MLKKRLPPLEPLVAFEAAARLLSFTRAAEELHLSQAAISQQIRSLEAKLQVKLFSRSHRAVQLTNEGREYLHTVAAILTQLAGATMDIQNVEFNQQLVFGCDQSFATQWLSPRISELRTDPGCHVDRCGPSPRWTCEQSWAQQDQHHRQPGVGWRSREVRQALRGYPALTAGFE